jgi:hypothetical protein
MAAEEPMATHVDVMTIADAIDPLLTQLCKLLPNYNSTISWMFSGKGNNFIRTSNLLRKLSVVLLKKLSVVLLLLRTLNQSNLLRKLSVVLLKNLSVVLLLLRTLNQSNLLHRRCRCLTLTLTLALFLPRTCNSAAP